jgi:hypothetical protein
MHLANLQVHKLKNPKSSTYEAARKLRTRYKYGLSGESSLVKPGQTLVKLWSNIAESSMTAPTKLHGEYIGMRPVIKHNSACSIK